MKYRLVIFLLCLVFGCSSEPSKTDAKNAIKKSIYDYYTCNSFKTENIEIDKIGLAQNTNSKNWWPVRAILSGKCSEIKTITVDPLELFSDSTFTITKDSTFELEYRLNKNMYDEWEASILR